MRRSVLLSHAATALPLAADIVPTIVRFIRAHTPAP